MEYGCVACDFDWKNGVRHIDLWAGGQGGNANDVINCEDNLTQGSAPVIVNLPNNEPVDTTPLFNSSTNTCYNPSSFNGAGTANGTTVDLYTCNGTGFGGAGTQVQIWSCSGNSNQSWTLP